MKLISNQINPHFLLVDAVYAASQLRYLWSEKKINFASYFGTENYQLFNAARSALETIIDIVQPPKTKKIALPAFICAVVAVPFVSRGYEIQWIDTDENGCIDFDDFTKKSDQVSMLIVPHIFGQIIDISPFAEVCRTKKIFLIEDCAHGFEVRSESLEIRNDGMKDETFLADVRLLSFGREKVVSCVSGGALLWKKDSEFAESFKNISLQPPTNFWTLQHALQPLCYALAMPWWKWGGKIIPILAQKISLLPKAVHPTEKQGKSVLKPKSLPYVQQKILAYQLQRFFGTISGENSELRTKKFSTIHTWFQSFFYQSESVLAHQKNTAQHWQQALAPIFSPQQIIVPVSGFRVILKTPQAKKIRSELRSHTVHLTEWDGIPIAPAGTDLAAFGYQTGFCPKAEFFAQNYLTLPTNRHITKKDVKKIANIIKDCIK